MADAEVVGLNGFASFTRVDWVGTKLVVSDRLKVNGLAPVLILMLVVCWHWLEQTCPNWAPVCYGMKLAHSELREKLDPIGLPEKAGELSAENGLELWLRLKLMADSNGLNCAWNGVVMSCVNGVDWSANMSNVVYFV